MTIKHRQTEATVDSSVSVAPAHLPILTWLITNTRCLFCLPISYQYVMLLRATSAGIASTSPGVSVEVVFFTQLPVESYSHV